MHKDVQHETTIPKIIHLFNSQFLKNVSLAVENKGTFFVEKAKPPDSRGVRKTVNPPYGLRS